MANPFLEEKYNEFIVEFRKQSVYELANTFNRETSHNGWVGVRGAYLQALFDTFLERKIDISAVHSGRTSSLKYSVFYREKENKLVQIIPLSERYK